MAGGFRDYALEGELGRGNAGCVYRARHKPTGVVRALKVLTGLPDAERVERFWREAQALARLRGAVAVPVHEIGVEGGRCFIAMGFMPGGSLRARLRAAGKLEPLEAVRLASAIVLALESCHAAGLVHRDLKPENVLFDEEGRVRLADFGIVRDLQAAPITESGSFLGTPRYMPPEQLVGKPVDARADLYALGVLLHVLVAGEPPYRGRSAYEMLSAKLSGPRAPLPGGMPPGLEAVIDRALAPLPERRYHSAQAMRRDLEGILAGSVPRKEEAWAGSWRAPLVVLGVGALVAVVGAWGLRAPEEKPGPARVTAAPMHTGSTASADPRADGKKALERARRALGAFGEGVDLDPGPGRPEKIRTIAADLELAAKAGVRDPDLGDKLMFQVAHYGGPDRAARVELMRIAYAHDQRTPVRARLAFELSKASGSPREILDFLAGVPDDPPAGDPDCQPRVIKADALLRGGGDAAEAERLAAKQNELTENHTDVLEVLARAQLETRNWEGALKTTEKLLRLSSTSSADVKAVRHRLCGMALCGESRWEGALAELNASIEAEPTSESFMHRAVCWAHRKHSDEARADLEEAEKRGVSERTLKGFRDEVDEALGR